MALRIGAVSYLNSKPLVGGLSQVLPEAQVVVDLPSRLADQLAAGQLDVALVPIVEYLRQPEFCLVSNACIACRGPVLSVKVFFRTEPAKVRRLALDEGSRTSAALARVLLADQLDVRPELTPLPIGDKLGDTDADAVLLIGDRAMLKPEGDFCEVWDLGERWVQWTNLPFVFAAWVANTERSLDLRELAHSLEQVRDHGLTQAEAIAETESIKLGIERQVAYDYLTKNLHFRMGADEQQGMQEYARRCAAMQLIPEPIPSHRFQFFTEYNDCSTR